MSAIANQHNSPQINQRQGYCRANDHQAKPPVICLLGAVSPYYGGGDIENIMAQIGQHGERADMYGHVNRLALIDMR